MPRNTGEAIIVKLKAWTSLIKSLMQPWAPTESFPGDTRAFENLQPLTILRAHTTNTSTVSFVSLLLAAYAFLLFRGWKCPWMQHGTACSRDGTRSRVTGSAILAGSGHGSVCQTWCLTRFWVLTCAFIMAMFLQSNTISANKYPRFRFGFHHSTTGLLISVSACNIYLLTCWLSFWHHNVSGFDII